MKITNTLKESGLLAAAVLADGVTVRHSSERLLSELANLIDQRKSEEFPPQPIKDAVRSLLKAGGFKPSGRNKPASEYLAQAAREGRFPFINNLVDINNLLSLQTGLPISLLNADAMNDHCILRLGAKGDSYVFNAAGQSIDLNGLICACNAANRPLGNPVKDSTSGKITNATKNVIAVIYAPAIARDCLESSVHTFADWLSTEGGADITKTELC